MSDTICYLFNYNKVIKMHIDSSTLEIPRTIDDERILKWRILKDHYYCDCCEN